MRRIADGVAPAHAGEPEPPVRPEVWVIDVDRPTLVLGSAQGRRRAEVDRRVADGRLDLEVVVRRSGGGAVYLAPGEQAWIDVIVPAGDRQWVTDVGHAFHWLGDVWRDVVAASSPVGPDGPLAHRGALVRGRWSDAVCFAGLGPGEVTVDGRKVVGISQRRTRSHLRFQATALTEWEPDRWLSALVDPADLAEASAAVRPAAAPVGADDETIITRFLAAVARR